MCAIPAARGENCSHVPVPEKLVQVGDTLLVRSGEISPFSIKIPPQLHPVSELFEIPDSGVKCVG